MVPSCHRPDTGIKGVELVNIYKCFDNLEVLKDLSLDISQGELCCLVGPSGCGKTTVLKIINGLLEADKGQVFLLGQDITDTPVQQRKLGMVFQNYALFPQMNVYDNIAYGLRRRRITKNIIRAKVMELLDLVQLPGVAQRRIHELSGGQQQRIALARALVIEPRALLLDEPLSNLDARLRADMRREIRRIQRQLSITTIYVTHDQEEAMSIADRIVVMNNGIIEQIGSPRDVYEKPVSRFVADFIGNINIIPGEVVAGGVLILDKFHDIDCEGRSQGTEVMCAVRPERVQLTPPGKPPVGTVREVVYFGSTVRYHVVARANNDDSQELIVEVPVSQAEFGMGDEVSIFLQKEYIRLLR